MLSIDSIRVIHCGSLQQNAYLVCPEGREDAFVVDPGDGLHPLMIGIQASKRSLAAILLTHGHFDHITGADTLAEKFDIDILIHEDDAEMLEDGSKNGSLHLLFSGQTINTKHVKHISGDAFLYINDITIRAFHTPGHSKGSVSYLIDNRLFSGDLVFYGSYGRVDLYGGDFETIVRSIRSLNNLPKDTLIYPGHGQCEFTIAEYFGEK